MHNKISNKRAGNQGFTLVELAIVLVIIGLLIGGILVAQSMINTTRIQSTIRQMAQFDSATSNFETKYDQLPGDTSLMGEAVGNNDRWIDDSGSTTHSVANWDGEIGSFWYDLSVSGLKTTGTASAYLDCSNLASAVNTNCDAALPIGTLLNTYIPKAPVGNVGYLAFGTAANTNYYALGSFSTTVTTGAIAVAPTSGLKPADALAIDTKIDNGVATTGEVRAGDQVTLTLTAAGTTCASAGVYVTGTTTPTCTVFTRVGLQTGELK